MIAQDRLKILLAVYERRLTDVADAAGVSMALASTIINCRRKASPELLRRIEATIIRASDGQDASVSLVGQPAPAKLPGAPRDQKLVDAGSER